MYGYKITVTQISDELNDPDDRAANPSGKYFRIAETEDDALDDFHSTVPIGCLEDFEILVSGARYKVWIDAEEIAEHEDGDCDYVNLDLEFAASEVFEDEKQAIKFAGDLHRIAEGLGRVNPVNNDLLEACRKALRHVQLLGSGQNSDLSNAEMCTIIGEAIKKAESKEPPHA